MAVGVQTREPAMREVRHRFQRASSHPAAYLRRSHVGLLLRQTIRNMGMREDHRYTLAQIKRMLIGNPMRKLQLLLGHAHEETVYIYLDVLDEAQEIVLAALDDWDEQAAALDRLELPERQHESAAAYASHRRRCS